MELLTGGATLSLPDDFSLNLSDWYDDKEEVIRFSFGYTTEEERLLAGSFYTDVVAQIKNSPWIEKIIIRNNEKELTVPEVYATYVKKEYGEFVEFEGLMSEAKLKERKQTTDDTIKVKSKKTKGKRKTTSKSARK